MASCAARLGARLGVPTSAAELAASLNPAEYLYPAELSAGKLAELLRSLGPTAHRLQSSAGLSSPMRPLQAGEQGFRSRSRGPPMLARCLLPGRCWALLPPLGPLQAAETRCRGARDTTGTCRVPIPSPISLVFELLQGFPVHPARRPDLPAVCRSLPLCSPAAAGAPAAAPPASPAAADDETPSCPLDGPLEDPYHGSSHLALELDDDCLKLLLGEDEDESPELSAAAPSQLGAPPAGPLTRAAKASAPTASRSANGSEKSSACHGASSGCWNAGPAARRSRCQYPSRRCRPLLLPARPRHTRCRGAHRPGGWEHVRGCQPPAGAAGGRGRHCHAV